MPGKQLSTSRIFTQHLPLPRLFQLVVFSAVILLLGGGVTLFWNVQHETRTGRAAGDVSVVGPPTVSATTIDTIFTRLGSPMAGTGKVVEQASRQTNIDDAFALGVWWTETNDGAAGVGLADHNPGSVRGSVGYPSAYDGYTIYPSYSAAIIYWFNLLHNGYVNGRGLSTVYGIARPYVGTTSYPLWASKVINLMWQYRGEAPPPPAVTPTPRPTVNPVTVAANRLRQAKGITAGQSLSDGSSSSNITLSASGQTQEAVPYPAAQSTNSSSLPLTTEIAIILCGLLAAIAIAVYALRLKIETPRPELSSVQTTTTATWNGLISSSMPAPSTEDLPPLPTPIPSLSSPSRHTDALPRRLTLLPLPSEPEMPVTTDPGTLVTTQAPSTGLLSTYGQNNRNSS